MNIKTSSKFKKPVFGSDDDNCDDQDPIFSPCTTNDG